MVEQKEQRRLAAIFAGDMVGYSRLMEADERGTIARQKTHRAELIDPKIIEHHGRIVKTTGDGILVEFASVVDAVECAVAIQRAMVDREEDVPEDRRIQYRVGINLGDIVIAEDDIFGDGVNIAARLEGLAEPGGVCISGTAYEHLKAKVGVGYADLGMQQVKNIETPVRVYRVLLEPEAAGQTIGERPRSPRRRQLGAIVAAAVAVIVGVLVGLAWWKPWGPDVVAASVDKMAFQLPDKPSIAVLPFTNLSSDKSQDFLADGVTEDIITDLSKISSLFVLGRNSTFKYKGKSVEARQVAEAFGVRYVLFGSIRRGGDKLRISVRLIDAVSGRQLWAERFDRDVKDIFAVQSDVTRRVVKTLAVTLNASETERLYQRHTTNIEAYETFLRARKTNISPSKKNVEFAEILFNRVIELDPKFAGGYAGLSFNYSMKARFQFGTDPKEERKLSLELAQKAVQVDKNFAWSYIALGGAYLAHHDPDAAVSSVLQALVIQPNGYEENLFMGFYSHFAGQSALAVQHLEKADRISPVETNRKIAFLAMAYFMNGDYAKSTKFMKEWIQKYPLGNPIPYVYLSAALVLLEKTDEAATEAANFRGLSPDFRLSKWRYIDLYKVPENRQRLYEAAKRAGVPE
jgi:adenylate cyclase